MLGWCVEKRRISVGAAVGCAVLAGFLVPVPTLGASETPELDQANRRWAGARCRSRVEISVKKGQDGDGWSKAKWLFWGEKGSNHRVRVLFSNSKALQQRFRNGWLPPGTEFVATGWGLEKDSLYLGLELVGLPVQARVFFYDDWVGRVSLNRLADFERWARFDFLEMTSAPEERLVDVAPTPAPARQPPPRTVPGPTAVPRRAPAATLHVMAASVEPNQAAPGSELQLIVIYEVKDLPAGEAVAVKERRTILLDGKALNTVEADARRTSGIHQSSQSLRIPASLAEGTYELRASIELAGAVESATAMFQVTK